MSKDIRSFFQPKKVQKAKDDDDIIPESPDVQIKNKKKASKKSRVLSDDSDEEIFSTKKKTKNKAETKNKTPSKPILKEVKVSQDLFGTGPIKRTEPLVKKKNKTELGIHSDDEFEKSLLEIDNYELLDKESSKKTVYKSPLKSETTNNKEISVKPSSSKEIVSSSTDESTPNKHSKDDVSKAKKHKHNHSESTKDSRKTEDNKSITKSDKKQNHSNESSNEKKSKIDNSKRKFSEFVDDDNSDQHGSGKKKKLNHDKKSENNEKVDEKHDDHNTSEIVLSDDMDVDVKESNRKRKLNKSLNESVLTDEERHERKIASAALYKSYLNRSGPKHLGAKEIPEGPPDCLKDCAFVLTGVLDSFEKDEIAAAINKYGGSVKSAVTKKVTHVLAGEDAGPAKMAKAQDLGIKIINEDEFLKMIAKPAIKKPVEKQDIKKEIKKERSPNKSNSKSKISPKDKERKDIESKSKKSPENNESKTKSNKGMNGGSNLDIKENKSVEKFKSPKKMKEEIKKEPKIEPVASSSKAMKPDNDTATPNNNTIGNSSMWVEKYKPQNIKQIIGQHGDASNVKKLMNWLTKWYVNRKAKLPKPSPWAKNDDGGYFKAALLSGPPGVGKTTTVSLVCKELGFDAVEFNASDTRNKTLIKEQIGELLTTTSLSGYAKGETGKQAVTKKHVLVMDEVDGMAGNEDRGGLQELIGLIKGASVPIICMCNDRNSQKMRSLVNYCYDLRFNRPRVDQIKSAMMSICFKEGIKIPQDVISQLITSANQDVRQTLNLLSMWAVDPTRTDADRLRKDAQISKKDVKLGPWDAIRKVFSAEEHKTMSINDKSDLFFYDYSLSPLFVQENYLHAVPHANKKETLLKLSNAADSISLGDLVDARIRGSQAWSLLPIQGMYASVIPGSELSGHLSEQIRFPGWLGKNSRATKMKRLCQEIHAHTRLSTSGSKSSIFLDYSTHIRDAIVNPLIKDKSDGITQSLEVLESYHLLREDLESLVELSVWPGQRNPTVLIDPKVKAAMTRTYNKKATALPYAPGAIKRGRTKEADDEGFEDEDQEQEEQPDSDPENDAMIKKKKVTAEKPGPSKEKASSKPSTSKKKKEK